MAALQARCTNCTDTVHVDPAQVRLVWPRGEWLGEVVFLCPACAATVRLPVNRGLAELLHRNGAPLEATSPVVLSRHPEPDAPPFTPDDLLDFHQLLERDDWFDRLLVAGG